MKTWGWGLLKRHNISKKLVFYRKGVEFWKFLASKVSDLLFRHLDWVSLSQLCPRAFMRQGVLVGKRRQSRQKLKAEVEREDPVTGKMRGRQKSSSTQRRPVFIVETEFSLQWRAVNDLENEGSRF